MEPSPHLQNEVARRLGDLGVSDADRKAYGIASAAIRMAVPEALEQIARAHRAAEFAIRRTDRELSELPALRYALSLYADGLADGGRFARQTLRPAAVDGQARPGLPEVGAEASSGLAPGRSGVPVVRSVPRERPAEPGTAGPGVAGPGTAGPGTAGPGTSEGPAEASFTGRIPRIDRRGR